MKHFLVYQISLLSQLNFSDPGMMEPVSESVLNVSIVLSSIIFILVFVAISFQLLHETAAALLGAVLVFLFTYVGGAFHPELSLLTFEEAMIFVDWNVIFLIMGMMIFMAILAETNVFRWLAFHLYRVSRGRAWLLVSALVTLTGVTSAFLNDVTAILLLVPLSIQVAVAIDIHPFAVVIPEVLASNIGGAATLIGDPPSTIVGSHLGLSFGEYLVHMGPIALICMVVLILVIRIIYRSEVAKAKKTISPSLLDQLASESKIQDRATLFKAIIVASLTFVFFFLADIFNRMPPSVVALAGATVLIIWVRPDMHRMIHEVDWTSLIFFIGIFITVGALDATGAIALIAKQIGELAGESIAKATLLMTWISGLVSGVVANIPFTVAALPVVDFLTETVPGVVESRIIYWALILGADLGGNATYLGSAPNIVAVGLLAQAGYRVTFSRFARDGVPVTIITLLIASIWLMLRY
jgi:Na+/H+ antiporter NhaD/arsenite permease-like protein